jgi:hypothetical protein
MRARILALGIAAASILSAGGSRAQTQTTDWSTPHSWTWPLYILTTGSDGKPAPGEPRRAIWTEVSEYQNYPGEPPYLHAGIDIRGMPGDLVYMPTDATIEKVYNYDVFCLKSQNACRLWFKTTDQHYLYYVSHVDFVSTDVPRGSTRLQTLTTEVRAQIDDVHHGVTPNPQVAKDKLLAHLFDIQWAHLHLGVFDAQNNYEAVDVTALLKQTGKTGQHRMIDDEPPIIDTVGFWNGPSEITALSDGEKVLSGSVDIHAKMHDTFYTKPDLEPFYGIAEGLPNTTGIKTALYTIRSVATGEEATAGTWFDMAHCPVCTGPAKPADCPSSFGNKDANFYSYQELKNPGNGLGAASCGWGVLGNLYDTANSTSHYYDVNGETYWHIVNNTDGNAQAWNTILVPDGRYQVIVEARDYANNPKASSQFVIVHNQSGPIDPNEAGKGYADAFIRDNDLDDGTVPSTQGGRPFFKSPDILVAEHDQPAPSCGSTPLTQFIANVHYDVYLCIHNESLAPVNQVKVKIFSADPTMIIDASLWHPIAGVPDFVGDSAHLNGIDVPPAKDAAQRIGPFDWTPSTSDASKHGHRCMLAEINAPTDPLDSAHELYAAVSNNVAQLNMQIGEQLSCDLSTNALPDGPDLHIEMQGWTFPIQASSLQMLIDDSDHALRNAWAQTPEVDLGQVGTQLSVQFRAAHVVLPAVPRATLRGKSLAAIAGLPIGAGPYEVIFQIWTDNPEAQDRLGDLLGGCVFSAIGPSIT